MMAFILVVGCLFGCGLWGILYLISPILWIIIIEWFSKIDDEHF
jgi:hypothetical protein